MAVTQKANGKAAKVPEFLREPLEAAQARLGQLEDEAQRILKDLKHRGRAGRKDLEDMVHRLSKQDWTEMTKRIEKLREQGVGRASEWRGRAETFRAEAMERVVDLQARAISFLGVATRDQVEELSKELERLAKRIGKGDRARRSKKGSRPPSAEA
jgi:hypothetical protein